MTPNTLFTRENRPMLVLLGLAGFALIVASLTSCGPVEGNRASSEVGTRSDDLTMVTKPVTWKNITGAAVTCFAGGCATGNDLKRTSINAAGTGYGAGASSTERIAAGDGYAQAQIVAGQLAVVFGLSNGDANRWQNEIDFAFKVAGSVATILENGVKPVGSPTLSVTAGDLLKVAVSHNGVTYLKNGVTIYTSTQAQVYPLVVDTALGPTDALLHDVRINFGQPTKGNIIANQMIDATTADGADVDEYKITIQPGQTEVWLRYEGSQVARVATNLNVAMTNIPPNSNFAFAVPGTALRYAYVRVWAKAGSNPINEPYRLFVTAPPAKAIVTASNSESITNLADATLLEAKRSIDLEATIFDAFDRPVTLPLTQQLRAVYGGSSLSVASIDVATLDGQASTSLSLPDCSPGAKTIVGTVADGPLAGKWSVNYNANEPVSVGPTWPRYEVSVSGLSIAAAGDFAHICSETLVPVVVTPVSGNQTVNGAIANATDSKEYKVSLRDGQPSLSIHLKGTSLAGEATLSTDGSKVALASNTNYEIPVATTTTGRSVSVRVFAQPLTSPVNAPFSLFVTAAPASFKVEAFNYETLTNRAEASLIEAARTLTVKATVLDAYGVAAAWPVTPTLTVVYGIGTSKRQVISANATNGALTWTFTLPDCSPGALTKDVYIYPYTWNINYNAYQSDGSANTWPRYEVNIPGLSFAASAKIDFAHICKEKIL